MKDLTKLKSLIAGSYGVQNLEFAGHPEDISRAAQAIVEANVQQVGFKEYLAMHSAYLTSKGANGIHIKEELLAVRKIDSYFQLD